MAFDWAEHKDDRGVGCTITPRDGAHPDLVALQGRAIKLKGLWLMGADDANPGEWALAPPPRNADSRAILDGLNMMFIASGDITVG